MKEKHKIILIASLISLALLIIFSIMQVCDSKILTLDNKWLFVSGVPILVGLVISGIVKSFKGFGVELETNLSEKVALELVGTVESYPTPEITKNSMSFLTGMQVKERTKIERLQFEYGKKDYYDSYVVREYIRNLNNLRFIEIVDSEGKFIGLLPAGKFKEDRNHRNEENNIENIELLIRSIEKKNITDKFNDFISDFIKKEDSLLEAYKKFKNSTQGKQFNGDQILPVLDSNDKMIGLTRKIKLTEKIAEQVVKSEK